ncbi:hypothetical protein ACVWZD_008849 [Streptomyces sp. TE3672]
MMLYQVTATDCTRAEPRPIPARSHSPCAGDRPRRTVTTPGRSARYDFPPARVTSGRKQLVLVGHHKVREQLTGLDRVGWFRKVTDGRHVLGLGAGSGYGCGGGGGERETDGQRGSRGEHESAQMTKHADHAPARAGKLTGAGYEAPTPAGMRFVDELVEAGATKVVRPACPCCHGVKALPTITHIWTVTPDWTTAASPCCPSISSSGGATMAQTRRRCPAGRTVARLSASSVRRAAPQSPDWSRWSGTGRRRRSEDPSTRPRAAACL